MSRTTLSSPAGRSVPALVGRSFRAMQATAACGADLVLAGHLYVGYTGDMRAHHVTLERSILVAQAGTAISRRTRSEPNSDYVVTVGQAGGGAEDGRPETQELKLEPPHAAGPAPVHDLSCVAFDVRAWDSALCTGLSGSSTWSGGRNGRQYR